MKKVFCLFLFCLLHIEYVHSSLQKNSFISKALLKSFSLIKKHPFKALGSLAGVYVLSFFIASGESPSFWWKVIKSPEEVFRDLCRTCGLKEGNFSLQDNNREENSYFFSPRNVGNIFSFLNCISAYNLVMENDAEARRKFYDKITSYTRGDQDSFLVLIIKKIRAYLCLGKIKKLIKERFAGVKKQEENKKSEKNEDGKKEGPTVLVPLAEKRIKEIVDSISPAEPLQEDVYDIHLHWKRFEENDQKAFIVRFYGTEYWSGVAWKNDSPGKLQFKNGIKALEGVSHTYQEILKDFFMGRWRPRGEKVYETLLKLVNEKFWRFMYEFQDKIDDLDSFIGDLPNEIYEALSVPAEKILTKASWEDLLKKMGESLFFFDNMEKVICISPDFSIMAPLIDKFAECSLAVKRIQDLPADFIPYVSGNIIEKMVQQCKKMMYEQVKNLTLEQLVLLEGRNKKNIIFLIDRYLQEVKSVPSFDPIRSLRTYIDRVDEQNAFTCFWEILRDLAKFIRNCGSSLVPPLAGNLEEIANDLQSSDIKKRCSALKKIFKSS